MTYQKGHKPHPNPLTGKPGKVPGTKGTITARFLEDLASHYAEEGHHVFKIVFRENPETYFKALVQLVPKEFLLHQTVNVFGELTDEQIAETVERIRQLRTINGSCTPLIEH